MFKRKSRSGLKRKRIGRRSFKRSSSRRKKMTKYGSSRGGIRL